MNDISEIEGERVEVIEPAIADAESLDVLFPSTWQGQPIPERRWIVRDIVPAGQVTLFTGHGGLGKSLLTTMLQASTALSHSWLGLETTPVKSLGIYCEDDRDEIQRRLANILHHHTAEFADLEDRMAVLDRVGQDNFLATFGGDRMSVTPFCHHVREQVMDLGAQLLVVDTLTDTFGGNELARSEVRRFIQLLAGLAREMDGAVVLTGHPSLSGMSTGSGFSGSTHWHNAVRSRLYLTAPSDTDGDSGERLLETKKANYGPLSAGIPLQWEDGAFVRPVEQGGIEQSAHAQRARRVFLACLDELSAQGRRVSESKHSGSYAPKVMVRMPEAEKVKVRDLETAMNTLLSQRKIKIEHDGPPSRAVSKIARA